jgi:hypothetical protein
MADSNDEMDETVVDDETDEMTFIILSFYCRKKNCLMMLARYREKNIFDQHHTMKARRINSDPSNLGNRRSPYLHCVTKGYICNILKKNSFMKIKGKERYSTLG